MIYFGIWWDWPVSRFDSLNIKKFSIRVSTVNLLHGQLCVCNIWTDVKLLLYLYAGGQREHSWLPNEEGYATADMESDQPYVTASKSAFDDSVFRPFQFLADVAWG